MAEAMLRHRLKSRGLSRRVGVGSAGTHVRQPGQRPDPRVAQVLLASQCPPVRVRASQVREGELTRYDLLLAMEASHIEFLLDLCPPGLEGRVRLVMDYAPGLSGIGVPDPYYGGATGFERVLDLIESASEGLLAEIRQQHGV